MTQAAAQCPTPIQFCRWRLTRLKDDGTVATGPNNSYVSDKTLTLVFTPNTLAGDQKDLVGGCDCLAATYRGHDKLRYWDIAFASTALEPALIEMLTGAALQVDASVVPVPIGIIYPDQAQCGASVQPPVAVEAWQRVYVGDAPAPIPFLRYVVPLSFWTYDVMNANNDFGQPSYKGFSRSNPAWSDVYTDYPAGVVPAPRVTWFFDNSMPAPTCGYKTVGSS